MMHWSGLGGGWMMIGWIFIFLIGGYLVFRLFDMDKRNDSSGKPIEILKRRYAEGSITKEEFEEKKKDLI